MNYIAFPEKPLQADIQSSKLEKKIPRAANTSLGKIFRLVLVEKVHQGLKKIMNDIAFPEKPLQADIQCSKLEIKFLEPPILR